MIILFLSFLCQENWVKNIVAKIFDQNSICTTLLVLLCTATNSLQAIGHFMALRFSYSGVAFYLLTQHNTCYPPVVAALIVAKDGEKAIC